MSDNAFLSGQKLQPGCTYSGSFLILALTSYKKIYDYDSWKKYRHKKRNFYHCRYPLKTLTPSISCRCCAKKPRFWKKCNRGDTLLWYRGTLLIKKIISTFLFYAYFLIFISARALERKKNTTVGLSCLVHLYKTLSASRRRIVSYCERLSTKVHYIDYTRFFIATRLDTYNYMDIFNTCSSFTVRLCICAQVKKLYMW